MKIELYLIAVASTLIILSCGIIIFRYLRDRSFNNYFIIKHQETYDLDDLFPVRLTGTIIPKMDYLDIPYNDIKIQIKNPTIRGEISGTSVNLSFICPKDRKKAIMLVKEAYLKTVKPFIIETNKNKAEYIHLIKLCKKQLPKIEKLACSTCKNTIKCQISFMNCNYERENVDKLLNNDLRVPINKSPVLHKYE